MEKKDLFLIVGIGILSIALLTSLLFFKERIIFVNVLFLGSAIVFIPYSLYAYFEYKKIENMEKEFPNFLRDLAEAKRSGLSLLQAFKVTSKNNYGALSDEVRKIGNKLSWNITLERVLDIFKNRASKSEIISSSLTVINQAQKSGGNTSDILDALADNIEKIKETKAEKASLLDQQVLMMYAIFFIFLGLSLALIKFLMPLLGAQQATSFSIPGFQMGTNPCQMCISSNMPSCMSCDLYFSICQSFGFGSKEDPGCYFKSLFFSMTLIQGIFTGLIAGQISKGSVVAGIKHSLVMITSGFIIFLTTARIGFI